MDSRPPAEAAMELLEPRLLLSGGLCVTALTPTGGQGMPFQSVRVQFSEPVQDGTFTEADVTMTGPGGALATVVNQVDESTYDIVCDGASALANFSLVLGPDIRDAASGNPMDQDHDGTPGEAGQDAYSAVLAGAGLTIASGDAASDGWNLVLYGGASTIDGSHSFAGLALFGGATLTHSAGTETNVYSLDLAITDALTIDATSMIDVSGKGYLPGRTHGNSTTGAAAGYAGGSYGGVGYDGWYLAWGDAISPYARTYGDYRNPTEPGAGASALGAGGGLVRISAAAATIDGAILAGGTANDLYGEGSTAGSGGGIRLDVGSLAGSGTISANGGNAIPDPNAMGEPYEGSGGGGRVAVYYDTLGGFDPTNVQALGGSIYGLNAGATGTVYLEQSGQGGELRIDSHGNPAGMWTPLGLAADAQVAVDSLVISGGSVVARPEHQMPIVVTNLTVSGGAVLTHLAATDTTAYSLVITASGTLMVASGSAIDVSGMGYIANHTTGNAVAPTGGGSYGGVGYSSNPDAAGKTYGDYRDPTEPGAGGWGNDMNPGGAGGGLVRITAGVAIIQGSILAGGVGGGQYKTYGCSGSGGGIWMDVGTLVGEGMISADGGTNDTPGGGGRVAVYYDGLSGFNLNHIEALGGARVGALAAPGTVYLHQTGQNPLLRIDSSARTAGMWTPLGQAGDVEFDEPYVLITGAGVTVRAEHPMPIHVTNLTLTNGATLTSPASTASQMGWLDLTVDGTLTVAVSAKIDVSGLGYLPGHGTGNSTDTGATNQLGGSYGGLGGAYYASGGEHWSPGRPYGDYRNPLEPGAGGGADGEGAGGGLARITAATLNLDGNIVANGATGWGGGGGSGGGIWLDVGQLGGAGTISAKGGTGNSNDGGGGGGRVAVYYDTLNGFDLTGVQALAGPGEWMEHGSTGTVYLKQTGQSGQLVIDSHGAPTSNWTPLGTPGDTEFDVENLVILGQNTMVAAEHQMPIVAADVTIGGQGNLAHRPATGTEMYWLDLTVTDTLRVAADGRIDVSGLGYLPGRSSGNSYEGGAQSGAGSYGGVGKALDNYTDDRWYARTYGDYRNPTEPGSGGGRAYGNAGTGGGLARITAATAVIDGAILAEGTTGSGATGSGGGVRLDAGTLSGGGSISVDGGVGVGGWLTGGGGRAAIYYGTLDGFDLGKVTALPGEGYGSYYATVVGGAGTVYLQHAGQDGELRIDSHGADVGMWTTLGQVTDDQFAAENLVITGSNVVVMPEHQMRLLLGSLGISGGAVLTHAATTEYFEQRLDLVVAGAVTITGASGIDVSGKGYLPGYTLGNLPLAMAIPGGSYGGRGGGAGAVAPYGLAEYPNELGTGSKYTNAGNSGGGLVHLTAGSLVLDGFIRADAGEEWFQATGGGAGGGVLVNVGAMSGSGIISARGGSAKYGGGGGGRVALYSWSGQYIQPSQVNVHGGVGEGGGAANGANGTLAFPAGPGFYWPQPASKFYHDQQRIWWDVVGVDPATVTVDLYAVQNGTTTTLAEGADPTDGILWDTTAQADGACEVLAVFRDADGNELGRKAQTVALNNAAEWHGGQITDSQTWTADKVHLVDRDVILMRGASLTISPGAIVKFARGTRLFIHNGASLDALATAMAPIVLTSAADDTVGGDTMLDGDRVLPHPGDWEGLSPEVGAVVNLTSHVEMRYVTVTHHGELTVSEVWLADSVHYVTSTVTVPIGMTLVIAPGTVVKFALAASIYVMGDASLVAQGSTALPITFTSEKDDSVGGDTNGDADASTPASGDWGMIDVEGGQATLDHVRVLYGGRIGAFGAHRGGVRVDRGNLTLTNSVVADSFFDGLLVEGPNTVAIVSNSLFLRNDRGIYAGYWYGGPSVQIINCTLDGNRIGYGGNATGTVIANSLITNSTQAGIGDEPIQALTVRHTDVWSPAGSGSVNYAFLADQTGLNGNVSADPLYRGRDVDDYRLGYLSPAIDAGDGALAPATDGMGAPRYDDPRTANTGTPAGNDYADMGAYEFVESAPSTIDLTVDTVTGPTAATVGQKATVQWTVTNVGTSAAIGPWRDAIYLSLGGVDNPNDAYLAAEVVSGEGLTLAPGQSAIIAAEVTVPAGYVGTNVWEVVVNTRNDVFEGTNRTNNAADSASAVEVSYPVLTVDGAAAQGQFASSGQSQWFVVQADQMGQDILLNLGLSGSGLTQLYVSAGRPVSRSQYDLTGVAGQASQQVQITGAAQGQPYYVLAYAASVPAGRTYTLSAVTPQFAYASVSPSTGGNAGNVTVEIRGTEIPRGVLPVLVGADGTTRYYGGSVYYVDPTRIYATFDLAGAVVQSYHVQLIAPNGSATTPTGADQAFQVVAGLGAAFRSQLILPATVRAGRPYTFQIEYTNTGDTDLISPIINVSAADNRSMGLTADPNDWVKGLSFLGYSSTGPAGVLRPGQSERVTVYSTAALSQAGSMEYQLTSQWVDPLHPRFDPVHWSTLAAKYIPGANPGNSAFWETFKSELGGTWDSVNAYLAGILTDQVWSGFTPDPVVQHLMQTAMAQAGERGGGLTDTEAPWILTTIPYDGNGLQSVDVIFSKTIDPTTFTAADVTVTTPDHANVQAVITRISGRVYEITFQVAGQAASLKAAGTYGLAIGPNIADTAGHLLDQDRDGRTAEAVDDVFSTSFNLQPGQRIVNPVLHVVSQWPSGLVDVATGVGLGESLGDIPALPGPYTPGVDHMLIQFSRAVQFLTFSPHDVTLTDPDGLPVPATAMHQLSSTIWQVDFIRQTATGAYTVKVGTDVKDEEGWDLDQDLDGIGGQGPQDLYTGTFTLADVRGARIVSQSPASYLLQTTDRLTVTFSEAIDPATLGIGQVTLTGPSGPVGISSVSTVDGRTFTIVLAAPLADEGQYDLTVAATVTDLAGNEMDQDVDGVNGGAGDVYAGTVMLVVDPASTVDVDVSGQNVLPAGGGGGGGDPAPLSDDPIDKVVIRGTVTYGGVLGTFFLAPHVKVQLWAIHGNKDKIPGLVGGVDTDPDILISDVNALTGTGDLQYTGEFVFNRTPAGGPILKLDEQGGVPMLPQFYVVVIAENSAAVAYDWSAGRTLNPGGPLWKQFDPDGTGAMFVPKVTALSASWLAGPDKPGLCTQVHDLSVQVNNDYFGPVEWIRWATFQMRDDLGAAPRRIIPVVAPFGDSEEAFYESVDDVMALGSNQVKYPAAVLHEYGHSIQNSMNGFNGLGNHVTPSSGSAAGGATFATAYGIIQESMEFLDSADGTSRSDFLPPIYHADMAYREGWASFVAAYSLRDEPIWNKGIMDAVDKARCNEAFIVNNNWWMGYDAFGYTQNWKAGDSSVTPAGVAAAWNELDNGINKDANTGDKVLGAVESIFWAIAESGPAGPGDLLRAVRAASAGPSDLYAFWNALPHTPAYETIFINNGVPITDGGNPVDDDYEGNDTRATAALITPFCDVAGEPFGPTVLNNLVLAEKDAGAGDWYRFSIPANTAAEDDKTRTVSIRLEWDKRFGDLDIYAENVTTGAREKAILQSGGPGQENLVFPEIKANQSYDFVIGVAGNGALSGDGTASAFGGDYVPDYSLSIDWGGTPSPKDDDDGPKPPPPWPDAWPHPDDDDHNNEGGSHDPNELIGPAGVGAAGYVPAAQAMPYSIFFENSGPQATLPAQEVRITNQLDADLDWSSFAMTEIVFDNHTITVPAANSHYYHTVVDLTATEGILVDVEAGVDDATGVVFCTLRSVDPGSLIGAAPEDPTLGLLPVNDAGHSGEGHVSYVIDQAANLPNGRQITNQASIVFDTNDPIATNTTLNTVDTDTPFSQVLNTSGSLGADKINLTWNASDSGSGVAGIELYVSDNGAAYQLAWQGLAYSYSYTTQPGHTYGFYTVATDAVGQRESVPVQADTTITIWGTQTTTLTGKTNKLPFTDADGTAVTVTFAGLGSTVVETWDNPVNHHGDIRTLTVTNPDGKGTLTIATKAPAATPSASTSTVGRIAVNGSLKSITAGTTALAVGMTVQGLLGTLVLGDVASGAVIDIDTVLAAGSIKATDKVAMTFGRVSDAGVNTHNLPIASIKAVEWTNTWGSPVEEIDAPWIGTITTTGRKGNAKANPQVEALPGDFSAGLSLSGTGAPKGLTLGTVKIAGQVVGSPWSIDGAVGAVTIAGRADDWTLQGDDLDGAGLLTVKTLTLAGVWNATILADGALGAIKAVEWFGGSITADSLTSLTTTGSKAAAGLMGSPGDFNNVAVTLRASAAPARGKATITALGSATIAGGLSGTWGVDMDAGAITVGGSINGWTLTGADDGDAVALAGVKSLTLGNVADASVTAAGTLGAVKALRWADGTIRAASLTSLAVTGRKQTAAAGAVVGDFGADVVLTGPSPAGKTPAAGAVTIAHDLTASSWRVEGTMTSMTVVGTATHSSVRAKGNINSLTLGAADSSNFMAGLVTDELNPTLVAKANMDHVSTIGSLTIKGWTVAKNQPIPPFLTDTVFLAPSMGTVSLQNNGAGGWQLLAEADAIDLRIKGVTYKDARVPKVPGNDWTWAPRKPRPGGLGEIPA